MGDARNTAVPGRVTELSLNSQGGREVWIEWGANGAAAVPPAPGQYLLAWALGDRSAPLASALFLGGLPERNRPGRRDFRMTGPIPDSWGPGTTLLLRGPLGHGFSLPRQARRVALAAAGESASRLLSLVPLVLEQDAALTLFNDGPLPSLPAQVEIYPLADLHESLFWADYLALDLPRERLSTLKDLLGTGPEGRLPCPAQALVWEAAPCGGMADCGVCALPARGHSWRLGCKDGPVFDLQDLAW